MPCTIDCGCTTTSMRVVGDAEQVVGLDHLQALVHQRGRVDRDLGAHRPGGMGAAPAPAVTSASRSCDQPRNGPPDAVSTSASSDVGRQRPRGTAAAPSARCRPAAADGRCARTRGGHQLAAGDQALLVGEGQVAAGVERRHRGLEPGGAHDRVQHDVGVGARAPARPRRPARPAPGRRSPSARVRRRRGRPARSRRRRARAQPRPPRRAIRARPGRRDAGRGGRERSRAPDGRPSRSRPEWPPSSWRQCIGARLRHR